MHHSVSFKYHDRIKFGNGVVIGPRTTLGGMGGITIGNHVRISSHVMIETGGLDLNSGVPYRHLASPIVIEDDAWIGTHAIVLAGVRVGRGALIGAGAVVTKDVPPYAIYVGAPGRLLEARVPAPASDEHS